MPVRSIMLLGDPGLYYVSAPVERQELEAMRAVVGDLHDTLVDFRRRHGVGRAIAAPQIGVWKRLIYMHTGESVAFLNPSLSRESTEMMEVWDDCMSFPDLLVKVLRHHHCRIEYRDLDWKERSLDLEGDLSELLQHECDHLEGILAVMRAIDGRSFALRQATEAKRQSRALASQRTQRARA